MLFLAMAFAALFSGPLIGLLAGMGGDPASSRTGSAIVFFGLLVAFYAILEYTLHRNYPDLRIRRLGNAGNVLGAVVGFFWAMLGISLLMLIIDYTAAAMGGQAQFINDLFSTSYLTPLFRQFFRFPLAGLRPLFPGGVPEVLSFFAR